MSKQREEQRKQREQRRKQHDEWIKIASESKKRVQIKDTRNVERTDQIVRRGNIQLTEPEDRQAFEERLNLALQRPINNDVKELDNEEPCTVHSLDRIRFWNDVNKFIDEIYEKTPKAFKTRFLQVLVEEDHLNL